MKLVKKREGRLDEAIPHFTEALRIKPDWASLMNNLAWLLATHRETKFYNPKKAVQFAEQACELTNYEDPSFLDTLAAAYAAAGRFSEAVATAEKAAALAASADKKKLAQEIQNHIKLYKSSQPYIEPPPKTSD